ncbi:PIN domain-containing protein [Solimonas sp. K1W22B-7]|uniref:PIN domain-containing protein n=1 Tax=Solimonas sp. K1W22B-7 TaxID=2303331 RepID=UPI000E330FE0|nr:PIN domain-containing protein [Solimonas sp. K1W22B-7]AXQ27475.1 PIN domain-containing protein [Solimonas sp. K1W22B-7]
MKPFLDTNILLYAVAQDDPRAEIADALLAAGGIISVQALNEFASVARRKLKMSWDEVHTALDAFQSLCPDPVPLTLETHEQALQLAQKYGLNLYDALMASAAILAGCPLMYSEDMQDGLELERRLTIRNPFAAGAKPRSL